ncbi:MAG: ATP-NAD kinase family protein [Candidatus Bathyarchaeota archaeon]|nr:ATP-NAD kinase family protein [Candidatus Bathyarchaeota archaeon]
MLKLGFLVNPIAGMGGKVGLKGTDGMVEQAVKMGAKPIAKKRGIEFLERLKELKLDHEVTFLTCPGTMGEQVFKSQGFDLSILPMRIGFKTTSKDTRKAIQLLKEYKVDLILFVGGDGTARDILDALADSNSTLVLGIPSGVKMYSGVFATNPVDAAYIVEAFVKEEAQLIDCEIIDVDENAVRKDCFNIRLYGFLKCPFLPTRIQGSKQATPEILDEQDNQEAIARFIVEEMNPEASYILGPGTTVRYIADILGIEKTLLGVDIYSKGNLIKDVNEDRILSRIEDWETTWIIVSPIGKQGVLFGRGNQQISPRVISLVGKERIIVLATKGKIQGIEYGVLRVDTGEEKVDAILKGYVRVATDYREWRLMRVE